MGELKRGDIVVAENPFKPGFTIVKRVLFLPEDIAVFKDTSSGITKKVSIPQNHVWLQGDNKANSKDSRDIGPVSMNLIHGIATHRVWPLNKIGKLK